LLAANYSNALRDASEFQIANARFESRLAGKASCPVGIS
jgi:hypothetical protein